MTENNAENDSSTGVLCRVFGEHPEAKIIQTLLDNRDREFNLTELAEESNVSKATMFKLKEDLLNLNLMHPARKIGRVTLYKLNTDADLTWQLLEFTRRLQRLELTKPQAQEAPGIPRAEPSREHSGEQSTPEPETEDSPRPAAIEPAGDTGEPAQGPEPAVKTDEQTGTELLESARRKEELLERARGMAEADRTLGGLLSAYEAAGDASEREKLLRIIGNMLRQA